MPRQSRTKLVPPEENQALEIIEDFGLTEQKEEPVTELDNKIECPLCHEIMELHSNFDKLMYSCECCSFLLKCV
jgi:hypothetical protein